MTECLKLFEIDELIFKALKRVERKRRDTHSSGGKEAITQQLKLWKHSNARI